MDGTLYHGDPLSNLLTLQVKLQQLVLSPLDNHLQILVASCRRRVCRVNLCAGQIHDAWSGHTITSNATDKR